MCLLLYIIIIIIVYAVSKVTRISNRRDNYLLQSRQKFCLFFVGKVSNQFIQRNLCIFHVLKTTKEINFSRNIILQISYTYYKLYAIRKHNMHKITIVFIILFSTVFAVYDDYFTTVDMYTYINSYNIGMHNYNYYTYILSGCIMDRCILNKHDKLMKCNHFRLSQTNKITDL